MPLSTEDLQAIGKLLDAKLEPIKKDILHIKSDLSLISKLNQIDDIRKEPRLRKLYNDDQIEA